jgi:hypothetical protein
MTLNQRIAPKPKSTQGVIMNGRTFSPGGGTVDLPNNDVALSALAANGWTLLPVHGTTAQRPTTGTPGSAYYDDSLGKTVFAVVWPVNSANVVAWIDGAGNSA